MLAYLRLNGPSAPYPAVVNAVRCQVGRKCYTEARLAVLLLERQAKVRLARGKDGMGRVCIGSVVLAEPGA